MSKHAQRWTYSETEIAVQNERIRIGLNVYVFLFKTYCLSWGWGRGTHINWFRQVEGAAQALKPLSTFRGHFRHTNYSLLIFFLVSIFLVWTIKDITSITKTNHVYILPHFKNGRNVILGLYICAPHISNVPFCGFWEAPWLSWKER